MGSRNGKPTSIILVCHSYPPVIGGSELEAQRICAELIRRGHRVKVVCAGGEPMPPRRDWIDPKGVPVRIYAGRWKGPLKDMVFALCVVNMLIWERNKYHLVYFLMQGLHLAAGLPVARILGKPILMKIGGSTVVSQMNRSRAGRLELRWLRQWAQCVMILNDGMRQEAIAHGFSAEQLLWMPNPVPTDEFAPCSDRGRNELRSQLGIPLTAPVVLYCGRFAHEKALPSLLDAFARVTMQVPEAMLVLVGDGPLRLELLRQVNQLGLTEKNVRFTGLVDPDEVRSWLKIADIFALVSLSEGLACALIEAMSTGLASVVSDIPANAQLIKNGEQGLLTPVGDSSAIADAIVSLFSDSSLRMQMGVAARETILANYSLTQVTDRYEEMFRNVLENEKRA